MPRSGPTTRNPIRGPLSSGRLRRAGWWVPTSLAIGDVIEFGVTWSTRFGRQHTTRWFGWIERATAVAVIVSGPYEHPECAIIDARPVVDELRLSQLASPWTSDDLVGVLPDSWDL